MRERISGWSTTYYKVVLPAFWLVFFGAGTVALWLSPLDAHGQPIPRFMPWLFTGGWLFGLALCWTLCFPLKHVKRDEAGLWVRHRGMDVFVPWAEITAVRDVKFVNPRTLQVELRAPGKLGRRFRFIPRGMVWLPFQTHPLVQELSERLTSPR